MPYSYRPVSLSTASQPKSVAVAEDSSVFVAEVNGIEVIRSNQKVFETKPKFSPSAVATSGISVAVGGDVTIFSLVSFLSFIDRVL